MEAYRRLGTEKVNWFYGDGIDDGFCEVSGSDWREAVCISSLKTEKI
jgi:hypothetical protein